MDLWEKHKNLLRNLHEADNVDGPAAIIVIMDLITEVERLQKKDTNNGWALEASQQKDRDSFGDEWANN